MGVNLKLINFKFETESLKFALSFNNLHLSNFWSNYIAWFRELKVESVELKNLNFSILMKPVHPLSLHIILHNHSILHSNNIASFYKL